MDDRSPDPAADAAGVVVLLRVHLGALLQREVLCLLGQHGAAALSHPREHRPLQSLNPAGQTLVSPILEVPQSTVPQRRPQLFALAFKCLC